MENINNQFSIPTFNNGLSYNKNNYKLTQHSSNNINSDRYLIDNRNLNSKDIHISKYTTDIINPIRRNELKQMLSIDSLFRDNPETSNTGDFIFTFQEPMRNVVSMKLCGLEFHAWSFAF